jgi:hypothetical protein
VGAAPEVELEEADAIGTISMSASTRSETGFTREEVAQLHAALPQDAAVQVDVASVSVKLSGTGRRGDDMARYDALVAAIKAHLTSADKVLLAVKKQASQVHTVRYGDK